MLNAVKHLYHIVERMRDGVVEMLRCAQYNCLFALVSNLKYVALLSGLLLTTASQAQIYSIKTLDGTDAIIRLRYKPDVNYFTIYYLTNKLIIPNYWATEKIEVLNKKFLEIRYYKRGGSGIGTGNTLLLCVSHGKLRQALHIESYSSNLNYSSDLDYRRTTQKINNIRLALEATSGVQATTYDTLVAGQNQNFKRISAAPKKTTVRFDLTKGIFYNYQKSISANLTTFKNNRDIIKKFVGIAPFFQLNNLQYIFVGTNWYVKDIIEKEYLLVD